MIEAAGILNDLSQQISDLRSAHRQELEHYRHAHAQRSTREDSTTTRLIDGFPAHPILTAPLAAQWYEVSEVSARTALEELAEAGVVRRKKMQKTKTIAYLATDELDLIDQFVSG